MSEAVSLLYADGDIAVAVKPAGLVSQASSRGDSFMSALSSAVGGELYPVHRLDRETSGVMVYARTQAAAASLSASFSQGEVKKYYLAVVLGTPEEPSGEYRDLLYHDARRNKSYVVACPRRGVRDAQLFYRVCGQHGMATLVAVRLGTGRTHQIRVQFASRGTPVYGDRRYGGKPDEKRWGDTPDSFRGIALACASITFPHPSKIETISFEYTPTGAPWDHFDIGDAARQFPLLP